jgi:hypothetical protein
MTINSWIRHQNHKQQKQKQRNRAISKLKTSLHQRTQQSEKDNLQNEKKIFTNIIG